MDPLFGIDPALLQGGTPPSPMDPIAAALQALAASGAQMAGPPVPSLFGTGYQDTNLGDPGQRPVVTDMEASQPTAQYDASGRQIHGHQLPEGSVTARSIPTEAPGVTAARERQAAIDDPSVTLPAGDVSGYTARETNAYEDARTAGQKAAQLKVQAEQEQSQKLFAAYRDTAQQMEVADGLYQQSRAAIEQKADADTAAWLQQYTAMSQREPNPGRWWENQSSLGKALWGLGMLFGSASVALTPGAQNIALQMVQQSVKDDMSEQRARLEKEMDAMRMSGQMLDKRNSRLLTDMTDDHSMELGRIQAMRQAYIQRAMAPGNAAMQASMAQADAAFAQMQAQVATQRRESAVQIDQRRLDRDHASTMAALQRNLQWGMQTREIAKDYDLAAMSAQAKQGEGMKDVQGVPLELGAKMVGSPLGDHVQVHKDDAVKMRGVFETANRRYESLRRVKGALDDGSFAERIARGDAELSSAATYLGYTTAKQLDPTGRLSDQDVSFAKKIDMGYDPTGTIFDKARFESNVGAIKKMVDSEMRDMPEVVSKQASTYLDTNLVGERARILWTPQDLHTEAPTAPNVTESLSAAGMGPKIAPVKDTADFMRRRALEESDPSFRGHELPRYDKTAVATFKSAAQGTDPDSIRKLAETTIKQYADTWNGRPTGDADTTRIAIQAEADEAIKTATTRVNKFMRYAETKAYGAAFSGREAPTAEELAAAATKEFGLTDAPDTVKAASERALKAYAEAPNVFKAIKSHFKTGDK